MAVENKYVDANTVLGNTAEPGANGHEVIRYVANAAVAAADDDGSIYRLFKDIPNSFRPTRIRVLTDGITGGTDYELGLYDRNLGAVVSKGLFMTNQTMASASRAIDGLANVSVLNIGNKATIAELLSLTPSTAKPAYDIALTADTVGAAAGNVTVILEGFAA